MEEDKEKIEKQIKDIRSHLAGINSSIKIATYELDTLCKLLGIE